MSQKRQQFAMSTVGAKGRRMIAYQTGREQGRDYIQSVPDCDKIAFRTVGKNRAEAMYRTPSRQREFLDGWMENWRDPHPVDCQCEECISIRKITVETCEQKEK